MLGNLHVRFGVGAGVKLPGLHHRTPGPPPTLSTRYDSSCHSYCTSSYVTCQASCSLDFRKGGREPIVLEGPPLPAGLLAAHQTTPLAIGSRMQILSAVEFPEPVPLLMSCCGMLGVIDAGTYDGAAHHVDRRQSPL